MRGAFSKEFLTPGLFPLLNCALKSHSCKFFQKRAHSNLSQRGYHHHILCLHFSVLVSLGRIVVLTCKNKTKTVIHSKKKGKRDLSLASWWCIKVRKVSLIVQSQNNKKKTWVWSKPKMHFGYPKRKQVCFLSMRTPLNVYLKGRKILYSETAERA